MDLVIRGGLVVDGSGNPWMRADVAINHGKIVKIGHLDNKGGENVVDADGLIVSPGFIDIHTHSDWTLLQNPKAESSVRQGVTTEIVGNCGFSAAPINKGKEMLIGQGHVLGMKDTGKKIDWNTFAEYLHRLEKQELAHNVGALVGHTTIRMNVMAYAAREASRSELQEMKELLNEAMEAGSFGLSSGLEYVPGSNANTNEVVELCRIIQKHGGFYASHIRDLNEGVIDAIREIIEISEKSGAPANISHLCSFFPAETWMGEMIKLIEKARTKGIEITADATPLGIVSSYPDEKQRPAGSTGLNTILPAWAFEGGTERLVERLSDPETREKFKKYENPKFRNVLWGRWDRVYLQRCTANRALLNKNFEEIARIRGVSPYDAAFDILVEEAKATGAAAVGISGLTTSVDNSRQALTYPLTSISSDTSSISPSGTNPQPATYGAYPCFFRKFVKMEQVLRLEDAVRKCTSLPAQTVGLKNRGMLREGMWADITVFDPARIEDKATYEDPEQFPEGIEYVIVNGVMVVEKGQQTSSSPGKVLRRK